MSNKQKIDYSLVKKEFDERGYELITAVYYNNSQKLQYICPNHKDKGIQEITFANFTKGRGCPYCAKRNKRTTKEYKEDLLKVKPNIEVLEEYVNLKTKIKHKCKICGYEWNALPDNLLHNKNGCPKCGNKAPLTKDEICQRIQSIDSDIEFIGKYLGYAKKCLFKCKICGNEWWAKPNNILFGKGCPKCKVSKGEKKIIQILNAKNINYQTQKTFEKCKHEKLLPFDFYIPSLNMCIEYDGIQHFEPCTFGGISMEQAIEKLKSCQFRDMIKTKYCLENNITLIRIPYYNYKNIEKIINSIIS